MKRKTVLLDMDGVIVDFVGLCREVHNMPDVVVDQWDVAKCFGMDNKTFWAPFEKEGIAHYWRHMGDYPWSYRLIDELAGACVDQGAKLLFCSCPTANPECAKGKLQWLQDRYGHFFNDYILTKHKELLANDHTVLVDDSEANVDKFNDAGGYGVLFPQPWNILWKYKDSRRCIVSMVTAILEGMQ